MDLDQIKTVGDLLTLNKRESDEEKLTYSLATEVLGHGPDISHAVAIELVKTLAEYHDCVVDQLMEEKDSDAFAWILDRDKLNTILGILTGMS